MEANKFSAMLILIVPQVLQLIIENYKIGDIEAADVLYKSDLYAILEQEDTKLWHLSPLTLFNMFDEEQKTGKITFPEEA